MNEADAFDLGEEASASIAPEDKLKKLHEMAHQLKEMNETIEETEARLEAMKSERHQLRIGAMPKLMNDLAMPRFQFDKLEFVIEDLITGSFPKDAEKRERAIELLKSYDAEGLLVASLEIDFPKSRYDEAERLFTFLSYCGYTVTLTETIHTQTYNAFARRRLEAGEEIDIEGLGMYQNKIVKVKEVKEKPAKKRSKINE